jgi:serine phosphatase RsbU (regulator of sigma subunit)
LVRELFEAAGTLRQAYRQVDWAATPLGPVSSWSPTLRFAVDLAFHTRFPVTLFWGPRLVLIYNEAYAPLIGEKHPAALGAPAASVFPEIWDTIGPMLGAVRSGAQATWSEDLRLLMDRHGFAEECFFTFSYSAVRDLDGQIQGVIDIAAETTAQVVYRRRLAVLATLADTLAGLEDPKQILSEAVDVLRTAPYDLRDVEAVVPGVQQASRQPPPAFQHRDLVVDTTGDGPVLWLRLADGVAAGEGPILVARLSAHLPVDEAYLRFLQLLGATVAHAFGRARARQAERRLGDLERNMSETLQRSLLSPPVQAAHLQVAVRYQPAAEQVSIGGDWYDSFPLPDGGLALVIGDVAGHDRHAAAGMAQIRNLLRGVAATLSKPPALVLAVLDTAMRLLDVNTFATAVLARVERDHGGKDLTMRWSNAGHLPPILLTPDGKATALLTPPDVMLGVHAGAERRDHTTTVPPGASVVFYTDGLIDRRDTPIDDRLAHLVQTVTGCQHMSGEQLCDHLVARYSDTGEDDIALLVLTVLASA